MESMLTILKDGLFGGAGTILRIALFLIPIMVAAEIARHYNLLASLSKKTQPPPAKSRWVGFAAESSLKIFQRKIICFLVFLNILIFDIFQYYLICHVPTTCCKIPSCPQMLTPELLV